MRNLTEKEAIELSDYKMTGDHIGLLNNCKCSWCLKMYEIQNV